MECVGGVGSNVFVCGYVEFRVLVGYLCGEIWWYMNIWFGNLGEILEYMDVNGNGLFWRGLYKVRKE